MFNRVFCSLFDHLFENSVWINLALVKFKKYLRMTHLRLNQSKQCALLCVTTLIKRLKQDSSTERDRLLLIKLSFKDLMVSSLFIVA